MKIYNWGFFFENGERSNLELPFGPEIDGTVFGWDGPWVEKALELYPGIKRATEEMGWTLAYIHVNDPVEKEPDAYLQNALGILPPYDGNILV